MSTPQQSATQAPATSAAVTSQDPGKLLDAILDKAVEYKPFLSEQQLTLTPRMVIRFMCKPTRSGKVVTKEQALHFCMLCKARGLNPWEGDAYIVGYDAKDGPEFSLITAHQAFLKRAEVHPEYDGMQSGVIVKRGDEIVEEEGDFYLDGDVLLGGWSKILFKNRSTPIYKRLRLGTFDKGFGRWNTDKAGMIVKCAEADGLRSAFPNSLGGMYLEDEMPGKDEIKPDDFTCHNGDLETKNGGTIQAPRRKSEAVETDGVAGTGEDRAEAFDEKKETKARRAAVKKKFENLGWDENAQDKYLGGRDLNAFKLDELDQLSDSLTEELARV
jgi:phage recombination protein Bet